MGRVILTILLGIAALSAIVVIACVVISNDREDELW